MLHQLIIDDFHPVAKPIAEFAKTLTYGPQEWEGHTYRGIGLGYSPEMFWDLLSNALGRTVTPKMEFFRIGTKTEKPLSYIHADNACAKFAVVWYLSEAPKGLVAGTAFWTNKETGSDTLTDAERTDAGLIDRLVADSADESKWVMSGLCGQKFNRVVIYPSNVYHSRYPQDAWGNDVSDARIVYTAFFD